MGGGGGGGGGVVSKGERYSMNKKCVCLFVFPSARDVNFECVIEYWQVQSTNC